MPQVTEYRINPMDEHGDIIDPKFFDTLREARKALPAVLKDYEGECVEWEIEKSVRQFATDGELLEDEYTVIESGRCPEQ